LIGHTHTPRGGHGGYYKFPGISEEDNVSGPYSVTGETNLSTEEAMNQEKHWMAMWKDAMDMLQKLREQMKNADDEYKADLKQDYERLMKKKDSWAKKLGLIE
jgi:hypothetical protein